VSLHFPAGCVTVIVGGSGSSAGKSALLQSVWSDATLITVHGQISVRGRDKSEWDLDSLRGRIAFLRREEPRMLIPAGKFGLHTYRLLKIH
jgi:ABC-type bacteriocin/lantibiotic exporter with double-glycine peptidase domain